MESQGEYNNRQHTLFLRQHLIALEKAQDYDLAAKVRDEIKVRCLLDKIRLIINK
jgi:protein-arginine kinase activator protein McsA